MRAGRWAKQQQGLRGRGAVAVWPTFSIGPDHRGKPRPYVVRYEHMPPLLLRPGETRTIRWRFATVGGSKAAGSFAVACDVEPPVATVETNGFAWLAPPQSIRVESVDEAELRRYLAAARRAADHASRSLFAQTATWARSEWPRHTTRYGTHLRRVCFDEAEWLSLVEGQVALLLDRFLGDDRPATGWSSALRWYCQRELTRQIARIEQVPEGAHADRIALRASGARTPEEATRLLGHRRPGYWEKLLAAHSLVPLPESDRDGDLADTSHTSAAMRAEHDATARRIVERLGLSARAGTEFLAYLAGERAVLSGRTRTAVADAVRQRFCTDLGAPDAPQSVLDALHRESGTGQA